MEMQDKKQYIAPEIIFETDLEVKAGSPFGISEPGIELVPGGEE